MSEKPAKKLSFARANLQDFPSPRFGVIDVHETDKSEVDALDIAVCDADFVKAQTVHRFLDRRKCLAVHRTTALLDRLNHN